MQKNKVILFTGAIAASSSFTGAFRAAKFVADEQPLVDYF